MPNNQSPLKGFLEAPPRDASISLAAAIYSRLRIVAFLTPPFPSLRLSIPFSLSSFLYCHHL